MKTKQKVKRGPQWREFDADSGKFITPPKIQSGVTLERFKPNALLHENSFINKVLVVLDKKRGEWLGSAGIRELYHVSHMPEHKPVNSFRPMMSILYSLGFVDRKTEGGHTALYRLKPSIKVSDSQRLYELAVKAKRREK